MQTANGGRALDGENSVCVSALLLNVRDIVSFRLVDVLLAQITGGGGGERLLGPTQGEVRVE